MAAHDPEVLDVAKAAKDSGLLTIIGTAFVGGIGWLMARVYRGIGHRITNVEQTNKNLLGIVEKKADQSDVDRILTNQAALFANQREDNQRTVDAIGSLTAAFNNFAVHVEVEIGKRPTREELKK